MVGIDSVNEAPTSLAIHPYRVYNTRTVTFDSLIHLLQELTAQGKSLRKIAQEDFGGEVNHAVIQRCLQGLEPVKPEIRKALGLPLFAERRLGRDPKTGRYVSLRDE